MANPGISKSAQKLVSKNPSSEMVIRDLVPGQVSILSSPFKRFGIVKIGGRGTIVKLKTGNLAVFNPVALTPEAKAKVEQLSQSGPSGTVRYLIAPDYEHHIFLTPWAKEYPDANVIGPEGLPEKHTKDDANKGTKFHHVFTPDNKNQMSITPEFDDEFNYEYFHSHQNKELVFFHKPTRTMIEADLLFNLPANEQFSKSNEDPRAGIMTKLFTIFTNTTNTKWQQRLLYYGVGAMDRKGFRASLEKVHNWGEFDRIIPCHGDVIEQGGSRILKEATAWFHNK